MDVGKIRTEFRHSLFHVLILCTQVPRAKVNNWQTELQLFNGFSFAFQVKPTHGIIFHTNFLESNYTL